MKPSFLTLKKNHKSSNESMPGYLDGVSLYSEIGYDIENLKKQNQGYKNTCATRMSLALIQSGTPIKGRLQIKKGPFKGRSIETGAKLLADDLSRTLGKPELLSPAEAKAKIKGRKGIIFFWKISGYDGGHIDLIDETSSEIICNSACYFESKEIWFWELQ